MLLQSSSSVTTVAVVLLLLSVLSNVSIVPIVQGHCVLEDPTHSTIGCVPTPAPTDVPSTLPSSVPTARPSSTPTNNPTGYIVYTTVGIEILVEDILIEEENRNTKSNNTTPTTPILNATQIEYFEQQTALYLQNTTAAYPEIYKIEIEDVVVTQQHTVQHSSNTTDREEGEGGTTDLVVTVNVIAAVMLNTTNLDAEENENDNTVVTTSTTTTTSQPERLSSSSLPVSARENVPNTNNNNKSNTVLSTFLQQFFQEPNNQDSLRAQLIATNNNNNNNDEATDDSSDGGGGALFSDIIQPRIEVEEEEDTNNKIGIGASVGWTILGMVLGLSVASVVLYGLIAAPARRRRRSSGSRAERAAPPQKPEDVLMLEIGGTRSSNDETQRHSNSQHHHTILHTKVLANRYEADVIPCTTSHSSSSNDRIRITTSNILNDDESNIDIPDTPGPSIETSVYTQNFHYNGDNGQDETQSTASNYSTQSAAPPPSRMKIHLYSVESNTSYTTENAHDHNKNNDTKNTSEDGSQKEDASRRRQHLPPTSNASKKKNTSTTFINSFKSKIGLPPLLPSHTHNGKTHTQDDKKKDTIELTFGSHIDLTSALNNNRRQSSESTTSVLAGTNNITMVNTDENDAMTLNRTPSWC